jgi:hypothetical protein
MLGKGLVDDTEESTRQHGRSSSDSLLLQMHGQIRIFLDAVEDLILKFVDINVDNANLLQNHVHESHAALYNAPEVTLVIRVELVIVRGELQALVH